MRISDWSSDVCSSDLHGLARLAKSTPAAAEYALPRFAQALGFTEEDRGRVLYQVALWTAASYEPESARRLAAVPASAYDERLHEWQAREPLPRSDWPAALAAIQAMGEEQRRGPRWTRFPARLPPPPVTGRASCRGRVCQEW